jgi:predicted RNA-binding Zn-ribbon protein involved in translation (DUF1610 family)
VSTNQIEEKIILPDSPESARRVTVTGWVSRDGRFFGCDAIAEEIARNAGATHFLCDGCGKPVARSQARPCDECREKKEVEQHAKSKRHEWLGGFLYFEAIDKYSDDEGEIEDFMVDNDMEFDDLRPMLCEEQKVHQIDEDYWYDDLPEDGDAPDELLEAIEVFNKAIMDVTISWEPTNIVATWKDAPKLEDLKKDLGQ